MNNTKGEFVRAQTAFRNWITADGSSGFPAEAGRYHLYVSLACPWAHRTLIVRELKGLQEVISVTVVDYFMGSDGWTFSDTKPKCTLDTVNGCYNMKAIYLKADPNYTGRNSVPVLWDKVKNTVVNNESSEIIEMFNREFNKFSATPAQAQLDLYPAALKADIDAINDTVYNNVNNGVYKCGFATSQEAYDPAVVNLFEHLEKLDLHLSKQRYLVKGQLTLADIRLFTTLCRFDWVYHGVFKCNRKQLIEYPHLWGFVRDLYQIPSIGSTVDKEHIRKHYYESLRHINPQGIVPIGPALDFDEPHGRESLP